MEEKWKHFTSFYKVSNMGNIKDINENYAQPKLMDGYLCVNLYINKMHRLYRIDKLVANLFIQNPMNLKYVEHKNTVKTDNRASNLRWVRKEDINNNSDINNVGRKPKRIKCITTGDVFESAEKAALYFKIPSVELIRNAANPNHPQKTAGFYNGKELEWVYIDF